MAKEKEMVIFRTKGYQNRQVKIVMTPSHKEKVKGVETRIPTKKVCFKGGILALEVGSHDEEIEFLENFMKTSNGRKYGIYIDRPLTKQEQYDQLKDAVSKDVKKMERLKAEIEAAKPKKKENKKEKSK